MNVLFIANYYPIPTIPARGVFTQRQAHALARAGVVVSVVHPVPYVIPGVERFVPRAGDFLGLRQHYIDGSVSVYQPRYIAYPGYMSIGIPEYFQVRAIKKMELNRPDVIHAHFAAPSGLVALEMARYWKIPFVLSLRGFDVNSWPHVSRFNRYRFRKVCRASDWLLAESRDLARKTQSFSGVEPEVNASGVALGDYGALPDASVARRELGLPDKRFLVLFVGNHIRAKGMEELLQVIEWNPKHLFVTLGTGPYLPKLRGYENVRCVGQCESSVVRKYMVAADVLVLPTHSEGMPNVLIEAGAAFLPIVATQVGGIPELIGDDERGLLVEARNAKALNKAIGSVQADRDKAQERAVLLEQRVRQRFDADALAGRLVEIYDNVIARYREANDR